MIIYPFGGTRRGRQARGRKKKVRRPTSRGPSGRPIVHPRFPAFVGLRRHSRLGVCVNGSMRNQVSNDSIEEG